MEAQALQVLLMQAVFQLYFDKQCWGTSSMYFWRLHFSGAPFRLWWLLSPCFGHSELKKGLTYVIISKYFTIFMLLPGEIKLADRSDQPVGHFYLLCMLLSRKTTFGPSMGILWTCLHGSWQAPMDRNWSELVPTTLTQESARAPCLLSVFS